MEAKVETTVELIEEAMAITTALAVGADEGDGGDCCGNISINQKNH
jgi:hypothetical protein